MTLTITVYGAGAIGGVTGAALARVGHDVLLVDRAEDLEASRRQMSWANLDELVGTHRAAR